MQVTTILSFCSVILVILGVSIVRVFQLCGRTITVDAVCVDRQMRLRRYRHSRDVKQYRPVYRYSIDGVQITGQPVYYSKHYRVKEGGVYVIKVLKRDTSQVFTWQDIWYAANPILFALILCIIMAHPYYVYSAMGIFGR